MSQKNSPRVLCVYPQWYTKGKEKKQIENAWPTRGYETDHNKIDRQQKVSL